MLETIAINKVLFANSETVFNADRFLSVFEV